MAQVKVKRIKAGKCPFCESEDVNYPNGFEFCAATSIFYDAKCNACGREFAEWYTLTFDGLTAIDKKIGETIDLEKDMVLEV